MIKNKKNRVLYEETEIDNETGEVIRRKTSLQFTKEPAYVKLYFDCLGVVIKNDGLNECLNDMLLEVLKFANYADEEQIVTLTAYQKEQICKKTGKSLSRLEQAITTWTKNKVLIRVSRGTYKINPWIFGKGEWRDISNLRAKFDFSGGNITVEREYNTKNKKNDSESKPNEELNGILEETSDDKKSISEKKKKK